MYADTITPSMAEAIDETARRRAKQVAYNTERGLDPQPLRKRIADILDDIVRDDPELVGGGGRQQSRAKAPVPGHELEFGHRLQARQGAGRDAAR